jgi:hypothetical protein
VLEGFGSGPYLKLSYYFPGTGWTPFPADQKPKQIIPPTSLYYNAEDDWIKRSLLLEDEDEYSEEVHGLPDEEMEDHLVSLQQVGCHVRYPAMTPRC